ncbi:MAG: winged helix-turn-helix domain-containing protein [Luteolibacter sp.]
MVHEPSNSSSHPSGEALLRMLAALDSEPRLRLLARLAGGRQYVSELAREVALSRPLVHMHLKRLEDAGLIVGHLELSADGKAMKYYEIQPFSLHLTPGVIREALNPKPSNTTWIP